MLKSYDVLVVFYKNPKGENPNYLVELPAILAPHFLHVADHPE
jgi:hypothetical protein